MPLPAPQLPPEVDPNDPWLTLPLEQLPELLQEKTAEADRAVRGYKSVAQEYGFEEVLPEDAAMAADPGIIQAATMELVQMGLLDRAAAAVTPQVLDALQRLVDQVAPQLYDVRNNPDDLMEVLEGVANGSLGTGAGAAGNMEPGGGSGGGAAGPAIGGGGGQPPI
jgi:hypothetical protein